MIKLVDSAFFMKTIHCGKTKFWELEKADKNFPKPHTQLGKKRLWTEQQVEEYIMSLQGKVIELGVAA